MGWSRNNRIRIGYAGSVTAILVSFLVLPKAARAADFYFEFYNFETGQIQSSFPFGAPSEIIVASKTQDVTKTLPIAIVIRADNDRYKNAIPNNPEQFCRGPDGCSIPGPEIAKASYIEITAMNEAGEVLATYTKGTPPATSATPAIIATPLTTPATVTAPTAQPPSAPAVNIPNESSPTTPALNEAASDNAPSPGEIAAALAVGVATAGVVLGGVWAGRRIWQQVAPDGEPDKDKLKVPPVAGEFRKREPELVPAPADDKDKEEEKPKKKPCTGTSTVYGTGIIEFNAPFHDEHDDALVLTGIDDVATAFIEAYKGANAHDIAMERARADAAAKCNKHCEPLDSCQDGYYCGGLIGAGTFPKPLAHFDPKNPPDSVKRKKREPTIEAGQRGGTIGPAQPKGYRYIYTITGKFTCTCTCQPGFWERLKQGLRWGGGSSGGHTGPLRPPVH